MDDFTFLKYMVCAKNRWNPCDEAVDRIPIHYWLMSYKFIELEQHEEWENKIKPHAEFIGAFANPEAYGRYVKIQQAQKEGKSDVVIKNGNSVTGYGHSDVVFDPVRGLVDAAGRVVVDLKTLEKNQSEGVMVDL